jgi:hypothetical protein
MNNNNLKRMQALIERIEILSVDQETVVTCDFQEAEKKLEHPLPKDYRYFCQRLGSGCTSEFIELCCLSSDYIQYNNKLISYIISKIERGSVQQIIIPKDEHIKLLQNSLFLLDLMVKWLFLRI